MHLDVPVNNYRWFRGFNDYDNWQASGVSGQGARSFYYPPKSQNCADCHMPLVASQDPGNIGGKVHSHRFPAANTAVPYANQDQAQLEADREISDLRLHLGGYLRGFAGGRRTGTAMVRRTGEGPHAMTGFAVGEEAEQSGNAVIREVGTGGRADRSFGNSSGTGIDRARGRGGAHAQDRPLLPRRHGGRFRCLAGTAGQATPTAA